ncbi:flagellar protein FlgN [Croceicoccus marinus]|nr:flagellar protein FlgN [Croceicoccus marinus]
MSETMKLKEALRQMLAVLEAERQAIAGLDLDAITLAARDKLGLCDRLENADLASFDEECRAMSRAARDANEVNRQMRNLVAANIAARIDMLSGSPRLYGARLYAKA